MSLAEGVPSHFRWTQDAPKSTRSLAMFGQKVFSNTSERNLRFTSPTHVPVFPHGFHVQMEGGVRMMGLPRENDVREMLHASPKLLRHL